jgi:hypothetical protein
MGGIRGKTWTVWLVLLMAALMPLRGWALAGMPLSHLDPAHAGATHAAAGDTRPSGRAAHADAPAPCHGLHAAGVVAVSATDTAHTAHTANMAHPADAADGDSPHAGGHTCASCALCHSALAAEPVLLPAGLPRLAKAPGLRPARDTGRLLVATLERPPRG